MRRVEVAPDLTLEAAALRGEHTNDIPTAPAYRELGANAEAETVSCPFTDDDFRKTRRASDTLASLPKPNTEIVE